MFRQEAAFMVHALSGQRLLSFYELAEAVPAGRYLRPYQCQYHPYFCRGERFCPRTANEEAEADPYSSTITNRCKSGLSKHSEECSYGKNTDCR